ncbi:hypothetical protein [Rhodoferax sp.]|uniref:hypothetical protein n=1 Tax=Rhodoferax sp. TaxID=50421 RepID=UPI0026009C0E|nr:hypothetical protein [Rhodoferax sp.]
MPETFPFITDPFFYAVTIPAVLLLGVSKSGFGADFGSLALPMMAVRVGLTVAGMKKGTLGCPLTSLVRP